MQTNFLFRVVALNVDLVDTVSLSVPGLLPDCDDDPYPYDFCGGEMSNSFLDGSYQVIKWQMYQPKTWSSLLDHNYKPL